jgi:ParB-like chromosome segregation protein Spo0J
MADRNTQYELVEVGRLIPYSRNARTHSEAQVAQIAASIREFGFLNPIIVSADNTILCGHGRFYAAQKLGLEKVPCIREEYLTEAQKRAYILADNKIGLNSGWDNDLLAVELSDLQEQAFDLSLTGFDDAEIEQLLRTDDAKDDNFDVDKELEKPVFSKRGDLWVLGRHRLLVGDSTNPEDIDRLMDGQKANLVVTDPPYNVDYKGTAGKIKNDNLEDQKFYEFLLAAFKNMERVMADDASIYVFHADTEGLNFRKAFSDAGFYLSGCCIWKKPSLVLGRSPYPTHREY